MAYNLTCKSCGQKYQGNSPNQKHVHSKASKLHLSPEERKAKFTPHKYRKDASLPKAGLLFKPTLEQRVATIESTLKAIKAAL